MTIKTVSIWDPSVRERPTIARDHPVIDGELASKVSAYLRSGVQVLRTTAMQPDWFAPHDGPKVRMSSYTDGEWLWNESLIYYVDKYHLSPGEAFVQYCAGRNFLPRKPTDEELREVARILVG